MQANFWLSLSFILHLMTADVISGHERLSYTVTYDYRFECILSMRFQKSQPGRYFACLRISNLPNPYDRSQKIMVIEEDRDT